MPVIDNDATQGCDDVTVTGPYTEDSGIRVFLSRGFRHGPVKKSWGIGATPLHKAMGASGTLSLMTKL